MNTAAVSRNAIAATHFSGKRNVHYTREGYAKIAAQVVEFIRQHGFGKQADSAKSKP